jgi:hypothetical protein
MYIVKKIHTRLFMKKIFHQALVAHACNPSYSGSRDQEDCSLKLAWANSSGDPSSRTPSQKKKKKSGAGLKAQGEGPEFNPQY